MISPLSFCLSLPFSRLKAVCPASLVKVRCGEAARLGQRPLGKKMCPCWGPENQVSFHPTPNHCNFYLDLFRGIFFFFFSHSETVRTDKKSCKSLSDFSLRRPAWVAPISILHAFVDFCPTSSLLQHQDLFGSQEKSLPDSHRA